MNDEKRTMKPYKVDTRRLNERDKPALILLPGMVCNARAWRLQVKHLADLVELQVADYQLARSLTDMAKRVLEHAPDYFLIAGHSMGGRVAMEIVRLAPERVLGLCLIGTEHKRRPGAEQGERETASRLALLKVARDQGMTAMAHAWLPHLIPAAQLNDQPLIDEIMQMIAEHTPDQLAAHIDAGASRPDAADVLASLQVPTWILAGAEDKIRPPSGHLEMATLVPHSQLRIIQNCGHMLTVEQPTEVNTCMREWIAKCLHTIEFRRATP